MEIYLLSSGFIEDDFSAGSSLLIETKKQNASLQKIISGDSDFITGSY